MTRQVRLEALRREFPGRAEVELLERLSSEPLMPSDGICTERVVVVVVTSPTGPNLDIADCPGLVAAAARGRPEDVVKTTASLVRKYAELTRDKAPGVLGGGSRDDLRRISSSGVGGGSGASALQGGAGQAAPSLERGSFGFRCRKSGRFRQRVPPKRPLRVTDLAPSANLNTIFRRTPRLEVSFPVKLPKSPCSLRPATHPHWALGADCAQTHPNLGGVARPEIPPTASLRNSSGAEALALRWSEMFRDSRPPGFSETSFLLVPCSPLLGEFDHIRHVFVQIWPASHRHCAISTRVGPMPVEAGPDATRWNRFGLNFTRIR